MNIIILIIAAHLSLALNREEKSIIGAIRRMSLPGRAFASERLYNEGTLWLSRVGTFRQQTVPIARCLKCGLIIACIMARSNLCFVLFYLQLVFINHLRCHSFETKDDFEYKHHDNLELNILLQKVNAKCPSISRLYQLSERSVNGWPLTVIELSVNPGEHQICKSNRE